MSTPTPSIQRENKRTVSRRTIQPAVFFGKLPTLIAQRPAGTFLSLCVATLTLVIAGLALLPLTPQHNGIIHLPAGLLLWLPIAGLVSIMATRHTHRRYGPANLISTLRLALCCLLGGFITVFSAHTASTELLAALTVLTLILLCLDGLDGYMARRTGLCSDFGARLDMETDAFLALVMTLLIWQTDKAGLWVLALGLMRYLFLGAACLYPALKRPLYPSTRRKTVCVLQISVLCFMLSPISTPLTANLTGLVGLIALSGSFIRDVLWLHTQP